MINNIWNKSVRECKDKMTTSYTWCFYHTIKNVVFICHMQVNRKLSRNSRQRKKPMNEKWNNMNTSKQWNQVISKPVAYAASMPSLYSIQRSSQHPSACAKCTLKGFPSCTYLVKYNKKCTIWQMAKFNPTDLNNITPILNGI